MLSAEQIAKLVEHSPLVALIVVILYQYRRDFVNIINKDKDRRTRR